MRSGQGDGGKEDQPQGAGGMSCGYEFGDGGRNALADDDEGTVQRGDCAVDVVDQILKGERAGLVQPVAAARQVER